MTATQLRSLGEQLLDIHGQHAWQSLTRQNQYAICWMHTQEPIQPTPWHVGPNGDKRKRLYSKLATHRRLCSKNVTDFSGKLPNWKSWHHKEMSGRSWTRLIGDCPTPMH